MIAKRLDACTTEASLSFYEEGVDALRFAACLGVFICHALPKENELSSRSLGVVISEIAEIFSLGLPLFFFISSYLISRIMFIEAERFGAVSLPRFFARRVLRIWPLYFLSISFAMLYDQLFTNGVKLKALLFFSIFMGNIYDMAHGFSGGIAGHLWSISAEEQFYIVIMLFILLFGSCYLRYAGLSFVACSSCYLIYAGCVKSAPMSVWVNPGMSFGFFGSGLLTACLRQHEIGRVDRHISRVILFLSPLIFVCAKPLATLFESIEYGVYYLTFYTAVAVGCASCLTALCESLLPIPSPIKYLGKISFGIYVYHWPVLIFYDKIGLNISPWFRLGLLLPVICISALSYRIIETPFLRMRSYFTRVPTTSVVSVSAAALSMRRVPHG